MPDVLHGLGEKDRAPAAEALTHYLISLEPSKFRRVLPGRAAVALGEGLYHRIGCVACHAPQNAPTNVMSSAPLPRSADCDDFSATRWRRVPQAGCRV